MKPHQQHDAMQPISADRAEPPEPYPPDPNGLVNKFRKLIWESQYERIITESVEQQLAAAVYGRIGGNQEALSIDSREAGIKADFPLAVQPFVEDQMKTVEKKTQDIGETTVLELQAEMAITNSSVDDLRSDLADEKQMLEHLETETVETVPHDVESIQKNLATRERLATTKATFRWLYVMVGLFIAWIIAVLLLESTLLFSFNFNPMLKGAVGVTQPMVIMLSMVVAIVLVYLGHGIWAKSTDGQWFSKIGLGALVLTLAVIRAAGMMSSGDTGNGSTDGPSDSTTVLALISMLTLAGLALAVLGGHASHLLLVIFDNIKTLREKEGENLATWQATLDAQDSHDAQLRAQRKQQLREIPKAKRRIRKIESAIRRKVAKTQKMIQSGMKKNRRTRLSGAVKAMARQFAAWRLCPPQTLNGRRNGHNTKATINGILLCVILIGMGCATPNNTSAHRILLLDNSASMAGDIVQDTKEYVLQAARDWVKTTAMPGDEFSIWWFSKTGHPFPAEHHTVTMSSLDVPAYAARERFVVETLTALEELFDTIPQGVTQSRLLETTGFISLMQDSPWDLTVVSDLHQDSRAWNTRTPSTDEELVNLMLDLCPPVRVPPSEVTLVTWPGMVARGQDPVQQHRKNRDLFQGFFRRWSPEAIVKIRSL